MFFTHDPITKIVATSVIPIHTDFKCDPLVVAKTGENIDIPVSTRRVFVVFTTTQKGRNVIRIYPLRKDHSKAPPAFVIVPNDSPYLEYRTTHICMKHKNFSIIRPLKAVYYKAKFSILKKDIENAPKNLLTLIKHLYFNDILDDKFIESVDKKFDKISKLIAKAIGTNYEHECQVALDKSFQICQSIFNDIDKIVRSEIDKKI